MEPVVSLACTVTRFELHGRCVRCTLHGPRAAEGRIWCARPTPKSGGRRFLEIATRAHAAAAATYADLRPRRSTRRSLASTHKRRKPLLQGGGENREAAAAASRVEWICVSLKRVPLARLSAWERMQPVCTAREM